MTTHTIPRTGNAPLKFEGELIAKSVPTPDSGKKGKEPKRWHELTLFCTLTGKYVLAISYRVEWKGEHDHHYAEVLPDIPSAVRAIQGYDPVAHVIGYPPSEQYAEKQARLLNELRQTFAVQVSELLNRDEFAEVVS